MLFCGSFPKTELFQKMNKRDLKMRTDLTIPDPNAYFDLTITDIKDKVIASEGYGQQMSHDINLKDKISILVDGKSYKLVMNGFNIVTDIVISK